MAASFCVAARSRSRVERVIRSISRGRGMSKSRAPCISSGRPVMKKNRENEPSRKRAATQIRASRTSLCKDRERDFIETRIMLDAWLRVLVFLAVRLSRRRCEDGCSPSVAVTPKGSDSVSCIRHMIWDCRRRITANWMRKAQREKGVDYTTAKGVLGHGAGPGRLLERNEFRGGFRPASDCEHEAGGGRVHRSQKHRKRHRPYDGPPQDGRR